jgi:hypothetical protein
LGRFIKPFGRDQRAKVQRILDQTMGGKAPSVDELTTLLSSLANQGLSVDTRIPRLAKGFATIIGGEHVPQDVMIHRMTRAVGGQIMSNPLFAARDLGPGCLGSITKLLGGG